MVARGPPGPPLPICWLRRHLLQEALLDSSLPRLAQEPPLLAQRLVPSSVLTPASPTVCLCCKSEAPFVREPSPFLCCVLCTRPGLQEALKATGAVSLPAPPPAARRGGCALGRPVALPAPVPASEAGLTALPSSQRCCRGGLRLLARAGDCPPLWRPQVLASHSSPWTEKFVEGPPAASGPRRCRLPLLGSLPHRGPGPPPARRVSRCRPGPLRLDRWHG